MVQRDEIRPAGVAGLFYPADKVILERDLSLFLENAPLVSPSRPVRAMIVPHAGYVYSGGVAARAYRQIMGKTYDAAVIIAPSHHESFSYIAVYPGKALRTPLGDIPLHQQLIDELTAAHPDIRLSKRGFAVNEHSLEVQLPFLKWVIDGIKIVPLMMGHQAEDFINILHNALSRALARRNCLLIASTDLSHFYSDEKARALDQLVIDAVSDFAPDRLYEDVEHRRCEMCGYGPAITAMKVARDCGASEARVLLYRNSGDVTGDKHGVVGYLAGVFY